ncbi:hypothetical protein NL676_015516 [Syzygium grande]|nr:hypothetical protein NL676_015516 [Syzygium grande]
MGKVKGKHRLDKFYRLAKEHGYRSRASWKLVQLDSKFSFLRSSRAVLDLCAAPGGWMQVAVQRVPVGSLVIGIDLVPIAPVRGAISIEQDITRPECRARVKKLMGGARGPGLRPGAPRRLAERRRGVGAGGYEPERAGHRCREARDSVSGSERHVFRSQDYNSVLYCLKQLFEKVEVDKPAASRSTSAEIFVLGLKYKAPAKIDPRLLDVKHLFQGSIEPPRKVVDVLRGTKQKRHRDGYEDGETIFRKVSSAADFISSESPLEILGSVTSILFDDPASLPIKEHSLTTEEVKHLCEDLRVLGKQDFKHLLKWRMQMRKALSPTKKTDFSSPAVGDKEETIDEDDKILNEMEELTYAMERKKKRQKKLLAKRRAKDKARKALGTQVDALEDGYMDHELFSLSSIKGKKDLVAVDSNELDEENVDSRNSEDEGTLKESEEQSSSDADSEEERKRYDEKMEEFLDEAYERFVARKEGSTKQRKRAKQAYEKDQLLEGSENEGMIHYDDDSDKAEVDNESNPLMVNLDNGEVPTQEEITNKWFSQDIFAEAVEGGDLGKYESDDEMQIDRRGKELPTPVKVKAATQVAALDTVQASKGRDDFEIVPAPATDSSDESSDDDSEDEDIDTKAEILACAKKMVRKKQREQILDDAYSKYMFDDEGLPEWFIDEERRHRQRVKPVTKEEIAAMKAQFKEIDARPAKKVAEAKARKKRAAMRKLDKIRKKANSISDQTDISDRSKSRMIDQLYKKAAPKKPQKEYVVAKKGVQVKGGKGKVLVDRRMKKDARSRGKGKQGKGGLKKGKNAKARGAGKGSGKGSGKGKMGNKARGGHA